MLVLFLTRVGGLSCMSWLDVSHVLSRGWIVVVTNSQVDLDSGVLKNSIRSGRGERWGELRSIQSK